MSLLATAFVALLSSFGHCYFMCGGFGILINSLSKRLKFPFLALFLYHLFRILLYIFLAFIFYSFSYLLFVSDFSKGIVFFVLGLFMILLSLSLLFRLKLLHILENSYIFDKILLFMKNKVRLDSYFGLCFLGALNGLLPCGLVYFYLALALSQSTLYQALLVMSIFGLCTLFSMMIFAKLSFLFSELFIKSSSYIAYLIILSYGLYLAYTGLALSR